MHSGCMDIQVSQPALKSENLVVVCGTFLVLYLWWFCYYMRRLSSSVWLFDVTLVFSCQLRFCLCWIVTSAYLCLSIFLLRKNKCLFDASRGTSHGLMLCIKYFDFFVFWAIWMGIDVLSSIYFSAYMFTVLSIWSKCFSLFWSQTSFDHEPFRNWYE